MYFILIRNTELSFGGDASNAFFAGYYDKENKISTSQISTPDDAQKFTQSQPRPLLKSQFDHGGNINVNLDVKPDVGSAPKKRCDKLECKQLRKAFDYAINCAKKAQILASQNQVSRKRASNEALPKGEKRQKTSNMTNKSSQDLFVDDDKNITDEDVRLFQQTHCTVTHSDNPEHSLKVAQNSELCTVSQGIRLIRDSVDENDVALEEPLFCSSQK